MALSEEDIVFVYSGGSNNIDPNKSIGGSPSINIIENINNSLFDDIFEANFIDYRCFYIFNNSETDSLYDSYIYLDNSIQTVSECQLGVSRLTDLQVISFSESPVSGDFVLSYENINTPTVTWNSNPNIFIQNLQEALNSLDLLSGVKVETLSVNSFSILFLENDNYRNHDLLVVENNNLSPSIEIGISKNSQGQPINSIAPLLPTKTTLPYNVEFYSTDFQSKLYIGDLRPKDGVPIWIRRNNNGTITNNEINQFDFFIVGDLVKNNIYQGDPNASLIRSCYYYSP
jgi:hypothetical protein